MQEVSYLSLILEPRVLSSIITALSTSVIAIIVGLFALYRYRKDERESRNKLIKEQLNEFYSPILSHLNTSHTLYMILKSNKEEDFVLLLYLLNNSNRSDLSESEKTIIEEILKILKKVEKLIIKKSGFIDDSELKFTYKDDTSYNDKLNKLIELLTSEKKDTNKYIYKEMIDLSLLSRFLINFKLLELAYNNKLTINNSSEKIIKFAKIFTFPKDINYKIRDNIEKLQKELI